MIRLVTQRFTSTRRVVVISFEDSAAVNQLTLGFSGSIRSPTKFRVLKDILISFESYILLYGKPSLRQIPVL